MVAIINNKIYIKLDSHIKNMYIYEIWNIKYVLVIKTLHTISSRAIVECQLTNSNILEQQRTLEEIA